MSSCRFTIAYTGDDVAQGSMAVEDIAPALLAIGELFNAANATLNGESAKVDVRISAPEHGSFGVELEIIQSLYEQFVGVFSGDTVTAALQLKELIFTGVAGSASLAALIKWLRGRSIEKVETSGDENVTITVKGRNNTIQVTQKVHQLHQNPGVRRALSSIVVPVQNEGIDGIEVRTNGETEERISKEEADYFDSAMIDEDALVEHVSQIAYTIVSLSFKAGNKWRLFDGHTTVTADIKDDDFLQRVQDRSEVFAMGDILICNVRTRQTTQGPRGLRTTYTVERVLEHRAGQRQTSMFEDTVSRSS